jgi:DNA-binding transcriptional LysR family regulator
MYAINPTIDLRAMRAFQAVAEALHFRRAAEQLNVAQPALSRTIRLLEEDIGTALLTRTTRNVELTEAGRVFLDEVRKVLAGADRAVDMARRAADGRIGSLTVAYMDFAINGPLPSIMRRFRRAAPEIEINLVHMWTARQREALLSGEIDLGFLIGAFSSPSIENMLVRREGLVAVLPESHPLAERTSLGLKDLRSEPFVLGAREFWGPYREQIDLLCQEAGFTPDVVQEAYNSDGIFGLVAAGLGVTLYTESARHLQPRGAVVRPLNLPMRIETFAAWRADVPSPARDAFVRTIAEEDGGRRAR